MQSRRSLMKDSVIYVGIDVHKDTNSVCMYDRQDNAFFAEAKLDAGTDIMVRYLEKAVKDYGLSGEFLFGVRVRTPFFKDPDCFHSTENRRFP